MTTSTSGQAAGGATKSMPTRGCLFYVRRGVIVLLVLIIALSLFGFAYETVAEARDRQTYLPPGQLFDVDGHQMHIQCVGSGSPTVILEAAGGHFSAAWAWVQPLVAQSTRVCAYDRAGYGWSDPAPEPRDALHIAADLHSLLALAGIQPPYVMVGHSVGGIYVRVYHAQYPGEVVGMVFVDATHPDNWDRQGESIQNLQTLASAATVLAHISIMRLMFGRENLGLPAAQNAAAIANISSATYWNTQNADALSLNASLEQARRAGNLDNLPLAVLVALTYPEGVGRATERALQIELAALSTNSSYQEIDGAGHITLVTNEAYAALVSEAIVRVIEAARSGDQLTQ